MQVNENDRLSPQEKNKGTNMLTIGIIALVLVISGAAYYYYSADSEPLPEIETKEIPLPQPAPPKPLVTQEKVIEPEPVVVEEKPLPEPSTPKVTPELIEPPEETIETLPNLANSDPFIRDQALTLTEGMNVNNLLISKNIAQQFAVFVDNFAQGDLLRNTSVLKGPTERFTATDISGKTYLNPDSYHRYDIYANLISRLNTDKLVSMYKLLYPLFEEAFNDLGYTNISFNERLHQAIQEVLDAPIIEDPIELSSVSVNYQFVDPRLENLPPAQKLMIRMGPENTRKIKSVFRDLKDKLVIE